MFEGSKNEDLKVFLREYKRGCISIGTRTNDLCTTFLPQFIEEKVHEWYEELNDDVKEAW
jgi:hypothetical protein